MVIMIIVVIIMAVFISNSGGSEAKVELSGDHDEVAGPGLSTSVFC